MKKICCRVFIFYFSLLNLPAQTSPLEVRKHVLENGFTIYLNEDKTAKEVYGAVVVKAGSKNDPADATGMAHYLEHLLFKGTTTLGTNDFQKEKPFLDSIQFYYDLLSKTKDVIERKRIQALINKQSIEASKFGLPTEFDKLLKSIGGTSINAFTTMDMTVFHNSFPGEQLEKWLDLYSERFQNPVFRSFQSELEVVYEEKNRGMDNFIVKLFEEMNKNLFKQHPYGTQTTIGTAEHLKNPQLSKMYAYFNNYYVANNMALVLCGNFDSEKALSIIREKFSKLRTGAVPVFPKYPETKFNAKELLKVRYTPIKVGLLGFKTIANTHADKAALEVFVSLITNEGETGRLNKLQRDGKFMYAGGFNYTYNDDGAVVFFIVPKIIGQSFNKVEKLLFTEINKIKKGELKDEELKIIKTELFRQRQLELENVSNRTLNIAGTFGNGSDWEDYLKYNKQLENLTKEDIIRVANKYFGENYFALHSKMGFPKKDILEKPDFKPVVTDQKGESVFAKKFEEKVNSTATPKFLNFEKDAERLSLNENNQLYVTPNPLNKVFTLKVEYEVGSDSLKNLDLTADFFNYFHTKELSTDQLKENFALLGLSYFAECNSNRFSIEFTGLDENFEQSLKLINNLVQNGYGDEKGLKAVLDEIKTGRKTNEKSPGTIGNALYEYAQLGKKSSYLDRLSMKELKALSPEQLMLPFKKALSYKAVWHYVGSLASEKIKAQMASTLNLSNNNKSVPLSIKNNQVYSEPLIYFVADKKAVQSQIHFLINSNNYTSNPNLDASISAFNQYIGGGFSGIILQEIREYRSLAYTSGGSFVKPLLNNKPSYFHAFIGCQADKTIEAIAVMKGILDTLPRKPERTEPLKLLLKNSASVKYPEFRDISTTIEQMRQRGFNNNPFQQEYSLYDGLSFESINRFYEEYIKNKPLIITIYGNKEKFDLTKLAQFGKIIELQKKDIIKN